ncbi:DUF6268 family outer membrane beta-barrel protein [Flavobacterium quisquiliarum]|uniref:DUF6268 family outer membrane beta-barrel protein n=1 Tax=Flavobacterium quisquiliarum TaxID=1834436 RepID=A0ABV8W5R8_9FLAO|nr:DUF6268 family outer membrane beta-barrel protein [Flavobacterium quisquiliarum]MBW1657096.1 hypothetical protein [Flavobacterium quisquiliarum]NWK99762.1 hypothetical protein [Flavobacterium collinsii]
MIVRFLICSLFSVTFLSIKAQENFAAYANVKIEPTNNINFNETDIAVSYKKNLGTRYKIANTLEYSNLKVSYELNQFDFYQEQDKFNQIQNKFEFSHEISEKTKWQFSIIPTANFQQNLDLSDITVLGNIAINQQLSSKLNLVIGAGRTSIFGAPKFTPIAALDYKFSDKANLRVGFPDSQIIYSNNERNEFKLTNSFNGNFYHLDTSDAVDKVVLSQITAAFEYDRNVSKNWFLNFKAGYDFNKKYKLVDSSNRQIYDYNIGNGYVLGIGIKYKQ